MKQIRILKKRFITLIEIMVVITLIALVAGALAINYLGSLDAGRAFKTKANIERIEAVLNIKASSDPTFTDDITNKWREALADSPLVKNPTEMQKDGWGGDYEVSASNGVITVKSKKLTEYEANKNRSGS